MKTPIKVAVWHRMSGGKVVYLIAQDNGCDVEIELATGRTALDAIEAAQDRVADLVRGLQRLHDKETKGEVGTL